MALATGTAPAWSCISFDATVFQVGPGGLVPGALFPFSGAVSTCRFTEANPAGTRIVTVRPCTARIDGSAVEAGAGCVVARETIGRPSAKAARMRARRGIGWEDARVNDETPSIQ